MAVSVQSEFARAERQSLVLAIAVLFARLTIAAGFLSAVALRLGLWGEAAKASAHGATVAALFARLDALFPPGTQPSVLWAVTGVQLLLAVCLVFGLWPRGAAFVSGVLYLVLGVGIVAAGAPREALDGSVFAAAACCFLLAALPPRVVPPRPVPETTRLRYVSPLT